MKSDECVLIWVIGEMDIIFVFETKGVGSIPAWPAKNILKKLLTYSDLCYIILIYANKFSNVP